MQEPGSIIPRAEAPAPVLPPVPSARGRAILLFLGSVLVEYWIAPLFVGLTNLAGLWSAIGNLLFAALVAAIVGLVIRPLGPHLRRAFVLPYQRPLFAGLVGAGALLGLFGTQTLSVGTGSITGESATWVPVYTPFGSFPSLLLAGPLTGVVNVEALVTVLLLALLGGALVVVRHSAAHSRSCPRPDPSGRSGWDVRVAWAAVWSPFGFVSSCSVCSPAYLAALGLVAPATAANAYAFLPLAPWVGFAGLLYLFSLGLVLVLLARATTPVEDESDSAEGSA